MFEKINESFSKIKLSDSQKLELTAFDPTLKYKLPMRVKYNPDLQNVKLYNTLGDSEIISNGFLELLGLTKKQKRIVSIYKKYLKIISKLKSLEPFKYQKQAICDALFYKHLLIEAATGAGKSYIIALLTQILYLQKLKGVIVVPNITLVNQIKSDFESYGIFLNPTLIGGNNKGDLSSQLTITTWQSLKNFKDKTFDFDFIIVDEAHSAKADVLRTIINKCTRAKYKIALTGTIPKLRIDYLKLVGLFGLPMKLLTQRDLIEKGLGTEIEIKKIELNYSDFPEGEYQSQVKFIKENKNRTRFISKLANGLKGNTIVLFSHTKHGLELFYNILSLKDVKKDNAYKDLIFQKEIKVFFINGLINGEQREIIRNLLEKYDDCILVANYSCIGTGTNIKNLKNIIFAHPRKSYVSVTQALGRLIRRHENKAVSRVFDIVDNFGVFKRHFSERRINCYESQNYSVETILKQDL